MNATQPHIVAITDDFASIAKAIGKDKVKVTSLVKGSKNLHNITPKTSMAIKVRSADLLIRLGMNQDSWIDGLIHVSKNSNILPGKPGYLDASKNMGNAIKKRDEVHKMAEANKAFAKYRF